MLFNELLLIVQSLFPKDLKLLERLKKVKITGKISKTDLKDFIGNPIKAEKIYSFYNKEFINLEKEIKKYKINLLFINEKTYPELLKKEFAPPLVLFYKGDISLLNSRTISMVGTRTPSLYGRKYAKFFAEELSLNNISVVSGMARGIDTESHKGALKNGKTIAVLGSNLIKIYPASNKKLYFQVIENGCAISEFSPFYPTLSSNFPIRNRIIAYLSPLTFVVEAKKKSGSLITAFLAIDAGRDIAAIPSNIDSKTSEGTNYLIKNGGFLIQTIDDILSLLPYNIEKKIKKKVEITEKEKSVLDIIPSDNIINFDNIVEKSDITIGELFQILLQLELKGFIDKIQGNNYRKREF